VLVVVAEQLLGRGEHFRTLLALELVDVVVVGIGSDEKPMNDFYFVSVLPSTEKIEMERIIDIEIKFDLNSFNRFL